MSIVPPAPPAPPAPSGSLGFSLVVPVHNEEGNLPRLWEEIAALFATRPERAEVLFVNDGSTDGSSAILDRLRAADARIRVLDHDRNHGLTAALDCGFRHARGAVIGMCDADLQNPPQELAKLLDALPGQDMVIGWRKHRDDPWLKRASSKIANGWRNWRTGEQVHDTGCGLKVFRREVIARIKLYNGLHRFLPTLARYEGFRVAEVVVAHRPRASGVSHYGVWNRLWRGMRDTKAVCWMRDRQLAWKATERPPAPRDGA
jgi:glycosyltransferase involved in cell wall biosynthesis